MTSTAYAEGNIFLENFSTDSDAAKLAVKILEGSKSIGIEPFNRNPRSDVGRIPTVKLKIPEKAILKSESQISVTFKLLFLTLAIYQWQRLGLSKSATTKKCEKLFLYFSQFFIIADLPSPNRCHW